jgi:hypothetical protein
MDSELLLHFQYPIKVFKVFGFWQKDESPKYLKWWKFVSKFAFMDLFLVLVHLLMLGFFDEEVFIVFFLCLVPCYKSNTFLYNFKSIENMCNDLQRLLEFSKYEENADRSDFRKEVKFMKRLFAVVVGTLVFSVLSDGLLPFFEDRLPYPMWIPYNYRYNEFVFWATSFAQIVVSLVNTLIFLSIYLFPLFLMGIAANLLKELSMRLKELSESQKESEENHKELVKCVELHLKIKSFVQNIESCFSTEIFVHGLIGSMLICLTCFMLLTVS